MSINILAVLVSAAAMFVVGFLMHGPVGGKTWMRLAGLTMPAEPMGFGGMWKQMLGNYIANVVMAIVMSMAFWAIFTSGVSGAATAGRGAIWAFWFWLGFVLVESSMDVIWMKKSRKLWLFDAFSFLLSMLAMGAILAAWM
jgi:hypothetical protein